MELQDNFGDGGDDFYAALMTIHEELDEAQSHALNARLVLILANEIGDVNRLRDLLALARDAAAD